jgi:23S rRNA pseudouridine1911/1915/1917 synthase
MSYVNPDYTELKPEAMDLNIIYEDDAVMVINKPANMVVHPGIGNYTGTLLNGVAHHLLSQNPDLNEELLPRFGLVHRIDKNTTGLIVLAKTPEAASHLAKQFFNHTVEKKIYGLGMGRCARRRRHYRKHILLDIKPIENNLTLTQKEKQENTLLRITK